MPLCIAEREVFYRERAAAMYTAGPLSLAQGLVELPYLAAQALIMICVAYWMVGLQASAAKFFFFLAVFFLTIAFYTFLGQALVAVTPSPMIAQLLAALVNQLFSYFNGFLVPAPQIPVYWKWANYLVRKEGKGKEK